MKLGKKLVRPCKYIILRISKLRLRKRLVIKFQRRKQAPQQCLIKEKVSPKFSTKKIVTFRSIFRLLGIRRKSRDFTRTDRMMELKSLSASVQNQDKSCTRTKSKMTTTSTNYVASAGSENREKSCLEKTGKATRTDDVQKKECSEEVEEACRSFEKYLVEMIVEKGRMKDLMDVEQLLYCLNNLRCPVFIDLVSRFYRELCKDLFTNN